MTLMDQAIEEAKKGITAQEGGPFGTIITDKKGNIIAKGHNQVLTTNDPTSHAEINAIREACKKLNTRDLSEYIIYSTCEPCPMCLSAIIWANIKTIYFGANRNDAAKIGFKDDSIYDFIAGKNELLKKIETKYNGCKELIKNYTGEIY